MHKYIKGPVVLVGNVISPWLFFSFSPHCPYKYPLPFSILFTGIQKILNNLLMDVFNGCFLVEIKGKKYFYAFYFKDLGRQPCLIRIGLILFLSWLPHVTCNRKGKAGQHGRTF